MMFANELFPAHDAALLISVIAVFLGAIGTVAFLVARGLQIRLVRPHRGPLEVVNAAQAPRGSGTAARGMRGVLLDVDGTLVDSNDAHACAWMDALVERDHRSPFERIRLLIGKGGDKLLAEVAGIDIESAEGRAIDDRRRAIFLERYVPRVHPFAGVRPLLERMRRDGLKLVVASSANPEELRTLLDIAGVSDLIEDCASPADAANSKPDPDIVQAALRRAELAAPEAVLIGDTPYDVEAARRAGVMMIAVRCGGWTDASLQGATAIYADPADLLAHYPAAIGRLLPPRRA